jgi:ferredoxin
LEAKVIAKAELTNWLRSLNDKFEIIAPVNEDGVTVFRPIEDTSCIDLTTTPATGTLREHFTPKTETLFEYELSPTLDAEIKPVEPEAKERLIFGVRACDAAALRYIDAVYSMVEPRDELYFVRREHTIIAGVFCNEPAWSCFCTEVGDFLTNPIEMDLFFTDIGEKFFVEVFTPKGAELVNTTQFQLATDEDKQAVEAIKSKALSRLPKLVDHAQACLSYEWEHPIWIKLAQKCLGCGVCAYSCPTCHCFDIQECPKVAKGSRYRCWDTCQFEQFTLMGAGHNPRSTKKERSRQRVFHKFKYSMQRYGILGCVGCGRCVALCPVNIDIRQIIGELESNKKADSEQEVQANVQQR